MTAFDGILILILASGLLWGFKRGFIEALLGFIAIVPSIWVGFHFSNFLEKYVSQTEMVSDKWVPTVSIVLTIALVYLAIKLISKLMSRAAETVGLGIPNRISGAVLGFGISLLSLSAFISYMLPLFSEPKPEFITQSQILPYLNKAADLIRPGIKHLTSEIMEEGLKPDNSSL